MNFEFGVGLDYPSNYIFEKKSNMADKGLEKVAFVLDSAR